VSPLIAATRRAREQQESEFARIVAFSDGVFAIAATLLVFTIEAPSRLTHANTLPDALSGLRYQILAYFVSFAVIAWLWVVHHRLFGRLTHFDRNLIVLNLVYLALIAFIPFSSNLLGDFTGEWASVVSYAGTLSLVTTLSALMWRYAVKQDLMREGERAEALRESRQRFLVPLVFLASIPIAFASTWGAIAFWGLILVTHPSGLRRLLSRLA
jgi:TMEM175 potassium channel family protein